ncbi:unnamed protein product, partial [Adineta ricciae]
LMDTFRFIFYLIPIVHSISLDFSNPLQRFIYDNSTDTIVLASVNHLYSLNASDLTILVDIDLSSTKSDHQCLVANRTIASKSHYYFSTSSYLNHSSNDTFNQLLLLTNNSILSCSTTNRGGSCQLRSLINLNFLRNSSQRVVSSSPFYPSVGLADKNSEILYVASTYDSQCDSFYEIPTISGRTLASKDFLSIIHFQSGQSALQQSTSTLRLLNIRLVKDFFLHYLYSFQYKTFSYFLTIQQSDIHHKHKLQTKILRFCQKSNQSIIKSYIELPLTCGQHYPYLITAKFTQEKNILYGLFRNTPWANSTSTSHAVCAYSIDSIQEAFFQTIKRCLVDGNGHRGLGFISPDTHCVSSKTINEINHDYCPDENEGFFQYPIGGHRALGQTQVIVELNDKVNFTSFVIGSIENESMVFLGDDNGTLHTFHTSNINERVKQYFPSKIIVDLQLIPQKSNLIILTDNQIIKQNLSTCEQYTTCNECSAATLCHWCSTENRCAAVFECTHERRNGNHINMCTSIEQVIPNQILLDTTGTELQIITNRPFRNNIDEYMCQFTTSDRDDLYYTKLIYYNDFVKCKTPLLKNSTQAANKVILSMYHANTNITFGYYDLTFINCSNFLSCSSCTTYPSLCSWNRQDTECISRQNNSISPTNHQQCPQIYLSHPINRVAYFVNKTFTIYIEQCNQSLSVESCMLSDRRQRFLLTESNPILTRLENESDLCLLKCSFRWSNYEDSHRISFNRPFKLDLAIRFSNEISFVVPHTQISLYRCERLATNCTSCLRLDPSFGCIWCHNQCMYKNESMKCASNQHCSIPRIQTIEPLFLPMKGGTLVGIQGEYFDLFNVSVRIAGIACQMIPEESSSKKIVCKSGNSQSTSFSQGPVHLKFGSYGPEITSQQVISYVNPTIQSIQPLVGIQNGGTILTILGKNFTIGNSHITVWIGNQSCQLLSISDNKIECETRAFPRSMLNVNHPIKFIFDHQTELFYEPMFRIVPNPIVYSFDKHFRYESFQSGGHRIIIQGENFHSVQNVQLEFQHQLFVSPSSHNQTHLIFSTPSMQELHLHNRHMIDITLYLDNFNRTASLIYFNDPQIFELQPLLQTFTNRLTIHGKNLTAIGHTKTEITVKIGCDLCSIIELQDEKLVCQPPASRPDKYSTTKHRCYSSEHPPIIVSIDNIQTQVGFMIYPKKLIVLGVISGCLITVAFIVSIVLLIVCLKVRYAHRKYLQRYFYPDSLTCHEIEKERLYQPVNLASQNILPIRSYLNYLQYCYYSNNFSSNQIKIHVKPEILDQFRYLLEHNDTFVNSLVYLAIQSNHSKILNDLVLTQRYNLKKLFPLQNDFIFFNICILTSYEALRIHPIQTLFSQLYYQLKNKLHSGPVDAIEQNMSYYSLNMRTILHDSSMSFKTIQLIVHIDLNTTNSQDLSINLTCLTCDTISQVKQKILYQMNFWRDFSLHDCKLYLVTNPSCSSSSSSSSTASSSVPLVRKSMLTQVLFSRTIKYSTTTINDPYRESNSLLLNDIDSTNEHVQSWIKLNTLQHYGILTDGYELKMVLVNKNMHSPKCNRNLQNTLRSSCHYCSTPASNGSVIFQHLTTPPFDTTNRYLSNENDHNGYIHLLNHTYEEIGGDFNHLLMNNNPNETYRLFETKSIIHSVLISLIETLFTNLLHSDTYLSELMEQNSRYFHIFYAHFLPFLFENFYCLYDIPMDKCLNSSLDILAMIFQRACCLQQDSQCLLCNDLYADQTSSFNQQNTAFLFADEIQRIRLCYTNLERTLHKGNSSSEYSSTTTGIDEKFQLDNTIFHQLFDYTYSHADEIVKYLKTQSTDNQIVPLFVNLMQMYRSTGKEVVTRDSNFDGLLHDPVEENITSILHTKEGVISSEDYVELMRITNPFHITAEILAQIMTIMEQHCQMGLDPSRKHQSDLKMLSTYVTNLPTKKERGEILALDLGGTNFRTLLVRLDPNREPQVISEAHIVPDSKKILAQDLFEFIVDVLKEFMKQNQLNLSQEYVLGFTFSFACEQIALNRGKFLTPSKGWILSDLVGQDVVEKLQRVIYEKQLKVKVTALINDTVGTLMACAYRENTCRIGVILGTGTNACYFEDIDKIQTISDRSALPEGVREMIINTEWGALGENGCLDKLITDFDREIDRISNNPGIHIFEKLISGMYMGRLAAEVLATLINRGLILKTQRDHQQSYRYYAPFHALRAAMLTAAAIAVLMKRVYENRKEDMAKICIGIDGSLYRFHPRFNMVIQRHLKILAPVLLNYELRISADGSGIGAAICAITANDARQALQKGEIEKSSFYQQHHARS